MTAGVGLEPTISCFKGRCAYQLHHPARIFKLNLLPLTHIEGFYQNCQKEIFL